MTSTIETRSYSLVVKVDGAPLSDSVQDKLISGELESTMHWPDSFRLVFRDVDSTLLDEGGFQLGTSVTLSFEMGNSSHEILTAEVTAVELEANATGRFVIVRGLDQSHRLMVGTTTKAYQQMTASDIVEQLVNQKAPRLEKKIDSTTTTYSVMTQANTSDWAFIQQMALLSDRQAFVSKGEFHFVKPVDTSSAPEAATGFDIPMPGQLVFMRNVLRIEGSVRGTEQVGSVEVRGWDPSQKTAIVGSGTPSAQSAHSKSEDPEEVAGVFGSPKLVFTDVPFAAQGEADALASSLAGRISGSMIELEGECVGDPYLVAGAAVSLAEAGDPFDGKYVVTSARHRIARGGYSTWFRMGGRDDRSLAALAAGSGGSGASLPIPSIPGVVTAKVSSTKDPKKEGRVQVTFPWLDSTYVSDWIRTAQIGASSEYGFSFIPEVNTEVLVAFDHGNPEYPFVVGGLYNGVDKAHVYNDVDIDDATGAVNNRSIRSRLKHELWFNDKTGNGAISLQTGDSKCSITLHAEPDPTTITIDSKGNVEIKGAQNVTISADQNMTIKAGQALSIEAANASVKANAEFSLQAPVASLKADGEMTVSGAMVKLGGG